jgi:flavin-dependent dehydrogenase
MSRNSFDVLIGGAGIAAAAIAIRLCSLGFRPLLLTTSTPAVPGVEAVPEAALALFAELGIEHVLRQAEPVAMDGFENHWRAQEPVVHSGSWIHFDRALLAQAAVREAINRGAVLRFCAALPKLFHQPDCIYIMHDGETLRFDAAVDATGRSSIWSRPIRRSGRQVADLYRLPADTLKRGIIAGDSNRWSYRLGTNHSVTLGIVTKEGAHRNLPDAWIQEVLGVSPDGAEFVGRRPAFPQWCEMPVDQRRLAIGDAALAYDPVAGQGACFAISSALAASATIATWRNAPLHHEAADRFYFNFVNQRRQRHLGHIQRIYEDSPPSQLSAQPLPEMLVFSGDTGAADVLVASAITTQNVLVLRDGTKVRWLGSLDLLEIRDFARQPVRSLALVNHLTSPCVSPVKAVRALQWCVQHGLLKAAS